MASYSFTIYLGNIVPQISLLKTHLKIPHFNLQKWVFSKTASTNKLDVRFLSGFLKVGFAGKYGLTDPQAV